MAQVLDEVRQDIIQENKDEIKSINEEILRQKEIKAAEKAKKKNIIDIPLSSGTIPHSMTEKYGAAKVFMKPANPGTGVIAGGAVRNILEIAGVQDVLTKSLGSNNPINVARATFEGLKKMKPLDKVKALRKGEQPKTSEA